ncbi:DUF2252 family protein [Gracilibacillus saliphilus]|uniref:DUF2252 family protein n=1 Tax=Gracilibacillus saliphilus TaxID=543890 RepID=UPI0013D42D88|nr:DUF2252 family protein [Gracilibacillus saliphilus]
MRRLLFLSTIFIMFVFGFTTNQELLAQSEDENIVDEVTAIENAFEDDAFLQVIQEEVESNGHAQLSYEALKEIKELTDVRELGIESIQGVELLTALEELEMRENEISDLSPLAELADLEILDLRDNAISSLEGIEALTNLKELNVRDNDIESLEAVASLQKLEELDIRENSIADITYLENLSNLEELAANENRISDLSPLKELTNLKILKLRENEIDSIEDLASLSHLEELDFRVNNVESLEPVRNLINLKILDFRDNSVTDIRAVENLVNLEELSARNNGISDLSPIANLTNLKELNIHTNHISDITPLENLTKIERLIIRRNNISDISVLKHLVLLEDLNMRDNNITDISPLSNLENLTVRLNLRDNPIKDFSPVAHYYDGIEDTDFIISDGPAVDLEDLNALAGSERMATIQQYIMESNQYIKDSNVRASKLERIAANPFAFYRGTASLFFLDVKNQVVKIPESWSPLNQANTWITGDLHIENLGFYGNRNGEAIFELNDFDEAAIAPFYFDLLNYGTSLYLLNDAAPNLQLEAEEIIETVEQYGRYYREAIKHVADGSVNVQEHYFTKDNLEGFIGEFAKEVSEEPLNGELAKWTTVKEGRVFDLTNNRLEEVTDEEVSEMKNNWDSYVSNIDEEIITSVGRDYFNIKDIARRINAGLGSLGYDRYYILIEGETDSEADDIILDVKAQGASAVEASGLFTGDEYPTHASRTISGVEAFLNFPDIHWGTLETENQSYLVKERSPFKDDIGPSDIGGEDDLDNFIKASAEVTAYAHSRAAMHEGNDAFAANLSDTFEEMDAFDEELAEVTLKYYAQVLKDHELYTVLHDDQAFDEGNDDDQSGDNGDGNDDGKGVKKENDNDNGKQEGNEKDDDQNIKDDNGDKNNEVENGENSSEEDEEKRKDSSESDTDQHNEKLLPKTATSIFNFLLLGMALLVLGGTVFWIHKRKNSQI